MTLRTSTRLGRALAIAALAIAGCRSEPAEPEVRLRLRYDVGDTLRYVYTADGTVTLPDSTAAGGQRQETYTKRIAVAEVATDERPNGNYRLEWHYGRPEGTWPGRADHDPFTLELEVNPQGRIVEVANVEAAESLFREMDVRTYLEQTQPVFPERALRQGDSWTQEVKLVSPEAEPVVASSTYVLESLTEEEGEPVAVIAFDGDVYLPTVFELEPPGGEGLRSVEERIDVHGRMYFAHERGVTTRTEATWDASIVRVYLRDGAPIRRTYTVRQESLLRLVDR